MINDSSKTRRLVTVIIILVLTNLAILAFFLWPRDKHSNKEKTSTGSGYGMSEVLKREVGLDSMQINELKRLRSEHQKKMRVRFADLQEAKNDFYILLKSPETPDSIINNAASLIAEKQKAIDMQVFSHFKNSRMVCNPQQRPKYDSLVQVIIKRMSGTSRNDNNRRRDDQKKK